MNNEIGRDLDPLVIRTDNNGTSTLTLNRPKSYNALSQSFIVEISVITPPGFASDSANTALTS